MTAGLFERLEGLYSSAGWLLPELCLLAGMVVLLMTDLLSTERMRKALLTTLSLITLGLAIFLISLHKLPQDGLILFEGLLIYDPISQWIKILLFASTAVVLLMGLPFNVAGEDLSKRAEYPILLFAVLLAASFMCMASNLLILYLSVELASIGAYLLTGLPQRRNSAEAALKYLIIGGMASAFMLYGISLLYGYTGTLDFDSARFTNGILNLHDAPLPLMVASFFLLGGLLFKLAAVPIHLWAPDAYQAASTPVAAFFSVVPKVAAAVALYRILEAYDHISLLFSLVGTSWQWLLAVLALLSMTLGNLGALKQNNSQRMLAYSSIAHTGFLIAPLVTFSKVGLESFLTYAGVYALMNLAAFWLIGILNAKSRSEDITAYKGLGRQYPWLGAGLLLVMVSLIGLPPTAGFLAKLLVFTSLLDAYQQSQQPVLMVLLAGGIFNALLALFYYLKIPFYLFFREQQAPAVASETSLPLRVLLGVLVVSLLIIFLYPEPWFKLIQLATNAQA